MRLFKLILLPALFFTIGACKQTTGNDKGNNEIQNNRPVPVVTIWVADTADMPIKNAVVYLHSDLSRDSTCTIFTDSMLTDKDGRAEFRYTKCPCSYFNVYVETPGGCRKKADNIPCRSGEIINCENQVNVGLKP